jgi:SAM-dependent methyltransferase
MSQGRPSIAWAQARELGYSLRRHYVDQFHLRKVPGLPKNALALDLGGNRIAKRGLFNIEEYGLRVIYANLSVAKRPHVQTDAARLPFPSERFDAVICSELLEHVPDPRLVLGETHRILRPGGALLICVPFLNRIHGDPYDYGRFTDFFWMETLGSMGYSAIEIERQGGFWSVLADMMRDLAYHKTIHGSRWTARSMGILSPIMGVVKRKAVEWDHVSGAGLASSPPGFTTGFGIKAIKT